MWYFTKLPKTFKLPQHRHVLTTAFLLLLLALLCSPASSHASVLSPAVSTSAAAISDKNAELDFPNTVTFVAHIALDKPVKRVTLEYGVHGLTCADVTAKAFPHVTDSNSQDVSWVWDMHKSGGLPTGVEIWYRWRVTDQDGGETVSNDYSVTWLDKVYTWQSINQGNITLHWYNGDVDFAQSLLSSAVSSMSTLGQSTGVSGSFPANLYIYASAEDLKNALLYEPSWIGGVAFPEYNTVLIGIGTDQLEWGEHTEAHELTHLLVGQFTFSCTSVVPTWLDEGIAVYGQGGPAADEMALFNTAVSTDKLLPVRALSGGFSAEPGKADLSYSESYSLVSYLINIYGKDKMRALFEGLKTGASTELVLHSVYGVSLQEFENLWRTSLALPPSASNSAALTPSPQPTVVPTYEPISAASMAAWAASAQEAQSTQEAAPAPTRVPDSTSGQPAGTKAADPPSNTGPAIFAGLSVGLFILVITGVIYFVVQRRSS